MPLLCAYVRSVQFKVIFFLLKRVGNFLACQIWSKKEVRVVDIKNLDDESQQSAENDDITTQTPTELSTDCKTVFVKELTSECAVET